MPELRKDYLLDRWVIISEKRGERPRQFKKVDVVEEPQACFFCPGNEESTPKEIGRVEENGKWKIRWFPNKFPAVAEYQKLEQKKSGLLHSLNAHGYQEVIVETPDHTKQLWDLSKEEIAKVLKVYALRMKELSKKKDVGYVSIFKNHGREGGTSIIHTHTQVIAYPLVPSLIKEELAAVKKHKSCPYCRIIKDEGGSERFVFENKSFIAFCPYASRYNYEVWIFPVKHVKNITDLNDAQQKDLAEILLKILVKLKEMNCSFNYFLHYSPKKDNLHFHIEITPRIAVWAGFEIATNCIINSVSPESAALFYRGKNLS